MLCCRQGGHRDGKQKLKMQEHTRSRQQPQSLPSVLSFVGRMPLAEQRRSRQCNAAPHPPAAHARPTACHGMQVPTHTHMHKGRKPLIWPSACLGMDVCQGAFHRQHVCGSQCPCATMPSSEPVRTARTQSHTHTHTQHHHHRLNPAQASRNDAGNSSVAPNTSTSRCRIRGWPKESVMQQHKLA